MLSEALAGLEGCGGWEREAAMWTVGADPGLGGIMSAAPVSPLGAPPQIFPHRLLLVIQIPLLQGEAPHLSASQSRWSLTLPPAPVSSLRILMAA